MKKSLELRDQFYFFLILKNIYVYFYFISIHQECQLPFSCLLDQWISVGSEYFQVYSKLSKGSLRLIQDPFGIIQTHTYSLFYNPILRRYSHIYSKLSAPSCIGKVKNLTYYLSNQYFIRKLTDSLLYVVNSSKSSIK